jgi:hypothetical protein
MEILVEQSTDTIMARNLFLKPIIRYVPSVKAEIIAIHLALKYRDN